MRNKYLLAGLIMLCVFIITGCGITSADADSTAKSVSSFLDSGEPSSSNNVYTRIDERYNLYVNNITHEVVFFYKAYELLAMQNMHYKDHIVYFDPSTVKFYYYNDELDKAIELAREDLENIPKIYFK